MNTQANIIAPSTDTPVAAISRMAVMVDLRITSYTGRRKDKTTQEEVTTSKGAHSKKAASVSKSLFADCKELDDIINFQASVRTRHYALTLPWMDNSLRLLPVQGLLAYQEEMNEHERTSQLLVDIFLDKYDMLVTAAAFKLGALFRREEYLPRDRVRERFSMSTTFMPMPTTGDFRLDIESEAQADLMRKYETRMNEMYAKAHADMWGRLYKVLARISDRLTESEDGGKKRFHDTVVHNASDLCELLKTLNIMGDPELERARALLNDALLGVSPMELRKSPEIRTDVKARVDAILNEFDFGRATMEDDDE